MTEVKPEAVVLDFREERTRRKNAKKAKAENYKPDFSKFKTYLDKSSPDKK